MDEKTGAWLRELGLEQYLGLFDENHLDWDTLPELDDTDLRDVGINSLGHRKKILRAISELVSPTPGPAESRQGQSAARETERRQVTVMFCDLVGSTRLSTVLDPEDMDAVIRQYQETVSPVVREFGGHIARYAGDGILIYFGYPQALEMESERAIRAALKAANEVDRSEFHPGTSSQVRIGIATGDVVVGGLYEEGKFHEAMATGETPNLAARLQGLASPGEIIICGLTRRLAGNLFSFSDEGERELKGFTGQIRAWRVTGSVIPENRFHALRSSDGATPLVGREREKNVLWQNWRSAKQGHGRGVLVTGDAGVGKSRLFKTLTDRIDSSEYARMGLYCEPYSRNTPFHPIINFFQRASGINPEGEPEEQLHRLRQFLDSSHDSPEEILPVIANLLGIEHEDISSALASYSPQRLMEETVQTGLSLIEFRARSAPLLILVDDLHYADPSTLKFLDSLFHSLSSQKVLLVMTARPELSDSAIDAHDFEHIELERLDNNEINSIIDRILGGVELTANARKQIIEKSDGIPLFVEELTKSLLEHMKVSEGDLSQNDDSAVPIVLQNSLMARLDRLEDIKDFTLTCAVVGREFSRDLVGHISSLKPNEIDEALDKLCEAELIQPLSKYNRGSYKFRHALLRDAAYNTLLRSRRRDIHSRVAEALLVHYPRTAAAEPERLAQHFAGAERFLEANQYYLSAGLKASQGGASLEAVEHLQRGLALLEKIEDEATRLQQELDFNLTLGPALIAVRGFGAEEVETSFSRGRELCHQVGASEKLLPALHGLMDFYIVRTRFTEALEVARESWEIMDRTHNDGHRLELQWTMGSARLFKGDVAEAVELLEQGLPLYVPEEHGNHAVIYGQDPGVALMTHLAFALTLQGEYARALEIEGRIEELVAALDHPFTKAQASCFLQSCALFRGDRNRVKVLSEHCIEFCRDQGFPVFMGMAMIHYGRYQCESGNESGLELLQQGLNVYTLSGADLSVSGYLAHLAESQLFCGQVDEGLASIERALQNANETEEKLYLPHLYYIEARLLLEQDANAHQDEIGKLLLLAVSTALAGTTRNFASHAAWLLVSWAADLPRGEEFVVRLRETAPDLDSLLAIRADMSR